MAHPSAGPDPDRDGWSAVWHSAGMAQSRKSVPATWSGIPPGEKHWHGAAAATAMTHIAIQEQLDGKTVEWMEKVSDEQYQGSSR